MKNKHNANSDPIARKIRETQKALRKKMPPPVQTHEDRRRKTPKHKGKGDE
jgi:Fe2+ transport system protein FeoA